MLQNQDGKQRKCGILINGDSVWNEIDVFVDRFFQMGAALKDDLQMPHHLQYARAERTRLNAPRGSRVMG